MTPSENGMTLHRFRGHGVVRSAIWTTAVLGAPGVVVGPAAAAPSEPAMVAADVVVDVLDEGAKAMAIAVEYSGKVDGRRGGVDPGDFQVVSTVPGAAGLRTVTSAYVTTSPERTVDRQSGKGSWVILELSRYDAEARVWGPNGLFPLEGNFTVTQTGVLGAGPHAVAPSSASLTNSGVTIPVVDDFSAGQWTGEGEDYQFRLFTPEAFRDQRGLAKGREAAVYPLVLALHGGGAQGTDNLEQLTANRVATSWAEPQFQSDNPAFVVAPQIDDVSWHEPEGIAGLTALVEDLKSRYPIDADRVYITGNSLGAIGTWANVMAHPELYAGAVATAAGPVQSALGTAEGLRADHVSAISQVPVWNLHGIADPTVLVASSTEGEAQLRAAGLPVVSNTIRGDLPLSQAVPSQQSLWDEATSTDAEHLFTYYEVGSVGTVPDADGPSIAPPTDHNAWMPAYANPVTHAWLMAQQRD